MKYINNSSLFFLSFLLILSSCTKTSLITLNSEKNIYSEEIGLGVSILPPNTFKRAKSFLGFQAPQEMGSISIEMDETHEQLR